jgi:hypothetical protein
MGLSGVAIDKAAVLVAEGVDREVPVEVGRRVGVVQLSPPPLSISDGPAAGPVGEPAIERVGEVDQENGPA